MKKLLVILGFVSFSVSAQKMTIDVKQVQSYFKYNIADTGSMYEDAIQTFSKTQAITPTDAVNKSKVKNVNIKYIIDFNVDSLYFYRKNVLESAVPVSVENTLDGVKIIRVLEDNTDGGLLIKNSNIIYFENYSNNVAEYIKFLNYKIR